MPHVAARVAFCIASRDAAHNATLARRRRRLRAAASRGSAYRRGAHRGASLTATLVVELLVAAC
jgi:hypothetical protein